MFKEFFSFLYCSLSQVASPLHHMDEFCYICGDIGVADAILTCRKCNTNQEHMYCMRVLLEKQPTDGWICEECESIPIPMPQSPQGSINHLPRQSKSTKSVRFEIDASSKGRNGPVNWEKSVKTGKTKYMSANEAIMLSDSMVNRLPSPTKHKIGSDRTPIKPKTTPLNSFYQNTPASGPSQQLKPKKVSFVELSQEPQQQSRKFSELQRSRSNVVSAQSPTNAYVNKHKEKPEQIKSPQTNAGSLMKKRSLVAPPVIVPGGNGCTSVDQTCNNITANVLPDASEESSYTPASDVVWKGSFDIQDCIKQRKLNQEILACPPSRVLKKVYDFSKRMPQLLSFDMVPLDDIWPKLFPDYLPDRRDIALYLFPRHHERYDDYILLLEHITAKNYALMIQIADVELLVFSSKLLSANCQCWEGKNFLWGVFHRVKGDATSSLKNSQGHDDEDNDMDIDMIGGINVGITDVVMREKSVTERFPEHYRRRNTPAIKTSPVVSAPILNVKLELDVPPELRIVGCIFH